MPGFAWMHRSMWTFFASKPVVCLLAAAFVLRAGTAFVVQGLLDHHWHRTFVIEGDADGYWRLAKTIVAGEPYSIYEPPRRVLRMPGFPLLLAVPIWMSHGSFLAARLFLAALGAIACGLTYLLGRDLFDERTGLWAGWFTAISPAMLGFSVMILSETAFALGLVGSVWSLARLLKTAAAEESLRRIAGWAIAAGGFIAFATFMRPSWLPMAVVFPVGLLFFGRFRRDVFVGSALLLATVVLLMLPWTLRNHRVTGHWVATTLWSGPSLYDGLNPDATGASNMEFLERDDLLRTKTEYEVNHYYWQAGMDYARLHPGRVVELGFIKLWRFWKPWPSAEEAGHWAAKTVIALFSLVLFAGAGFGLWLNRRRGMILALTLGPVLFFSRAPCDIRVVAPIPTARGISAGGPGGRRLDCDLAPVRPSRQTGAERCCGVKCFGNR